MKAHPCVIDTMVLRKANAPLIKEPQARRDFCKRLELLRRIKDAELRVLISPRLLKEYGEQVLEPRNDFVKSFFELLADPARHQVNYYKPWGRKEEARADCGFPHEDTHVLRTAFLEDCSSTIFSEEARMLRTDACIYRRFSIHIRNPVERAGG